MLDDRRGLLRQDMNGRNEDVSAFNRDQVTVETIIWMRRLFVFLVSAAVIAALGMSIAGWVEIRDLRSDVQKVQLPECLCPGNPGIGVSIGSAENLTALVATNTLQQLEVVQPSLLGVAGRSAWVSRRDELWVPDAANNLIYIYQTLTWNLLHTISAPGCLSPKFSAYHPRAGVEGRGQVWLSCTGSDSWQAFDPDSREMLVSIPLSASYASAYDPYDVRVGSEYVVFSLQNTTGPMSGVLLQYSTINFTPTASFAGLGPSNLLWYEGDPNSFLYVSSFYTDEIFKIDFSDLSVLTTASVPEPTGITADVYERFVYAVSGTSNGTGSIYGFEAVALAPLGASPYDAPTDGASDIITDVGVSRLLVTFADSVSDNMLTAIYTFDKIGGDLTFYDTLPTGAQSTGMTRLSNACQCNFCELWK